MSSDDVKLILQRLNAMQSRLGNVETGVMNLGTRLEALENTVAARLQDTRPLLEGVQAQLVDLREGQEKLREGQEKLREDMVKGFRLVERKVEVLAKQIVDATVDQRILRRRS